MTPTDRANNARAMIAKQLAELNEIAPPHLDSNRELRDSSDRLQSLERWSARTERLIRENISGDEADKFKPKGGGVALATSDHFDLVYDSKKYRTFLIALDKELLQHPEDFFRDGAKDAVPVKVATAPTPGPHSVFIVHGHDQENALRLQRLLKSRFGIDGMILQDVTTGGAVTVIEKLEREAKSAKFAFVLLTPDDLVQKGAGTYEQARPNVFFEIGYFYGLLGRARVMLLKADGTTLPSDLAGTVYTSWTDNVETVTHKIDDELKRAGLR